MRAARLKTTLDPAAVAERKAGRTVLAKSRPARRAPSVLLIILLVLAVGWGGSVSYLLHEEKARTTTLLAEQEALTRTHDEKIKALTRRLVGVASHQIVEQGGVQDRMADIIEKQIELETRQLLLGALATQISAPIGAGQGAMANPVGTSALADGSQGFDFSRIDPAAMAQARAAVEGLVKPKATLASEERLDTLRASNQRVGTGQAQALGGLAQRTVGRVQEIRGALGELGFEPDKMRLPPARALGGMMLVVPPSAKPGSFEDGVRQVAQGAVVYGRWRDLALTIPLGRPLDGELPTSSSYGPRVHPITGKQHIHSGMDFPATTGTPVRATAAGKVVTAEETGGYGNMVELDHGNGITTRYAHLSAFDVAEGQIVLPGAIVGRVGSTGQSTGPHLHYETRRDDVASDPMRYLQAGLRLQMGF